MPLDEKNIETTIRLLIAHSQRYAEIQDIANRLLYPAVYRSRDGTIAVGQLTKPDIDMLTAKFTDLMDEADVIRASIRQALAP